MLQNKKKWLTNAINSSIIVPIVDEEINYE